MSEEKRAGMWDTFDSRYRITGQLRTVTGLRVGTGGDEAAQPSSSNLPVLVGIDDRPYIPGSSLRGVFRSQIERVMRSLEDENQCGHGACNPTVESEWCIPSALLDIWRQEAKALGGDGDRWLSHKIWDHSCRVCQTFGSPWLASRVRIADLYLSDESDGTIQRRDGVAIDRDKETVQHKFDFETVTRGNAFDLSIIAENLNAAEMGLLWLGLRELDEGHILVGGFKGRGLGSTTLDNLKVAGVDARQRPKLRNYILKGTLTEIPESEREQWLDELLKAVEAEEEGEKA